MVGELPSVVVLAAALVPHPPVLVPALASGAASILEPLLGACEQVVNDLLGQAPETIVCVGPGERTTRRRSRDWGTLAGYGVAVEAPSQHDDGLAHLPLSLTIGRWLLERVGWQGAVVMQEVESKTSAADCAQLGRELDADVGARAGWLVLGDGSNRRGPRSPGHDDPRAEGFDAAIATAFDDVDLAALAGLDSDLAAELGAAGRVSWQVLAAAAGQTLEQSARPLTATVRYQGAPFGVGYLVGEWRFDG
jgi:hypothetical protein